MADFDAGDVRLDNPEADRLMVSTPQLWRYLPQLIYYPVRGYGLGIVLVMGFLAWLAGYAGPFGIALMGILFGWLGHYCMHVVSQTANGHAVPPPLGTEVLFQGDKLRFGLLFCYLGTLSLLLIPLLRPEHPAWSMLALVSGIYLFPAFIASLALQPDLLAAINPWTWVRFAWQTGLPYFCTSLLLAGMAFLMSFLSGHAGEVVGCMLTLYTLLFVCHLIGYVAYHRQDEIDLAVAVQRPTAELTAALEQVERLKEVLAIVDRHLEAKAPRTALEALMADDGTELANPRGYHEDLFEALRQRRQDALSLLQADRLLQLLAKEKRYSHALDICEQCLDISRDYVPQPASLMVPLAEQAWRDKRLALFVRIADRVQACLPGSDEAVSIQFLKAQMLVQQKQDAAALAILTPLVGRTTHPLHARIKALHQALASLKTPRA